VTPFADSEHGLTAGPQSVTLHTTHGELKVELFCEATPKAAENFLALAAAGYYDGCLFHRNMKTFMVQTGDPTGTGKGGQSIWGQPFEDEIKSTLKVRACLSSATSGGYGDRSLFSSV